MLFKKFCFATVYAKKYFLTNEVIGILLIKEKILTFMWTTVSK